MQTSLRKWALHQKCRYSLQVQLRSPITVMVMGINSGSGLWYSRSRAGHNCQKHPTSLCLCNHILYDVSTRASITLLPCYTIALFLFSVPPYFIQVYGFLPILSIITFPSLSSQSVTYPTCRLLYSPDCPFRLRTLFRFLPLSHIPFFIASLLFCCA